MAISILEQVKIQARVLVPLMKALRTELGEERANALARKALGDTFRQYGRDWWQKQGSGGLGEKMEVLWKTFSAGDALDYEVLKKSPDAFDLNVTGCRYAKFFQELGEPELGFLLVCSQDFTFAEGFGAGVELQLTQTIMQGASHCAFRYQLKK
jgi:L-2-amino-thiazoline-4-carboxylic acid hydrolase-like protein